MLKSPQSGKKNTTKVTSNLYRFLNFMQRFLQINPLTISNLTIPTWDCVSLRVHKTSQKIPRKDLQFHSPPRQNENNCQTATGKPVFRAVMHSMPSHVILPRAFGKEGRNSSMLCAKTFVKKLPLDCFFCNYLNKRITFPPVFMKTSRMKLLALNLPTDAPFLLQGRCALLLFYLSFIMIVFKVQNVQL